MCDWRSLLVSWSGKKWWKRQTHAERQAKTESVKLCLLFMFAFFTFLVSGHLHWWWQMAQKSGGGLKWALKAVITSSSSLEIGNRSPWTTKRVREDDCHCCALNSAICVCLCLLVTISIWRTWPNSENMDTDTTRSICLSREISVHQNTI